MKTIAKACLFLLITIIPASAWGGATTIKQADTINNSTGGFAHTVPAGASGDSFVTTVACGTSGYLLSWNGSVWVCVAPSGAWTQEVPSGNCNGSNTSFTLANTPLSNGIVNLSLNGVILRQGAGLDYTISGSSITLNSACNLGQSLYAIYAY